MSFLSAGGEPHKLDEMTAAFAAQIIRDHKPQVILMHFLGCDEAQHMYGPGSPPARQAYEAINGHIGSVLKAIHDAGVELVSQTC